MSELIWPRRRAAVALAAIAAYLLMAGTAPAQAGRDLEGRIAGAFAKSEALQKAGKPAEAVAVLKPLRDEVRAELGPDHLQVASVSHALGFAYAEAGEYEKAEGALRDALRIAKGRPDYPADSRIPIVNNLVEVLVKEEKREDAFDLSREALAQAEAEFGRGDRRTNLIRGTLAKLYLVTKQFPRAIATARINVKAAEADVGPEDPETIPYRHTLATALMEDGQYDEAETLFRKSLAIAEKKLPPAHDFTTATKNGLASILQLRGRIAEARDLGGNANDGILARPGARPSDLATGYNNQATKFQLAGDFPGAEKLYLQAEAESRKAGPDHPQTAGILANLSGLYAQWGRFAQAERVANESWEITRKNPGPGTIAEAKGKMNLALIRVATNRHKEAEGLLEASYETLRDKLGPVHPDTMYALTNYSGTLRALGRHREAVARGEEALAEVERKLGETSYTATILFNLGQSYLAIGDLARAETAFRRSVAIFEREPGPPTPNAAVAQNALAGLLQLTGRPAEAARRIQEAVATTTARLGPDHPDTTTAVDNLATMLAAAGQWRRAADAFDRSRRARRRFLDRTLPAMTADDQVAYLDMAETISRDAALSLALAHRSEPEVAARSAEWVLNSKGVAVAALARQTVLGRDATNSAAAGLFRRLCEVQAQLAARASFLARRADSKTPTPAISYEELVKQEQELSRQLGLALQLPPDPDPWVRLEEVRAKLHEDAILVEFARVRFVDFRDRVPAIGLRPARYVAWVIPPSGRGDLAIVDLGPTDAINRAVAVALDEIRRTRDFAGPADEADAERRALVALGALADKVLGPLRPYIDEAPRWFLSPDGDLWLVPWCALPVGERRYAVESHMIRLMVSGRELAAANEARPGRGSTGVILARPNLDIEPGAALMRARRLGRAGPPSPIRAPARSAAFPPVLDDLPWAGKEASEIRPLLETYLRQRPDVFLGEDASETVFKSVRGPRVMVLATHGIALADPDPSTPAGSMPANPLLRCGLALAGYNNTPTATAGEDDGLLTGLEVVGVDLRGTELVVLSGCETAVGRIRAGEGVVGLRQAFQIAGARAVVASLWTVSDKATVPLMTEFFRNLSQGRDADIALWLAQRIMIRDRRAGSQAAHPFYWAAFALTGTPPPGRRPARR